MEAKVTFAAISPKTRRMPPVGNFGEPWVVNTAQMAWGSFISFR